MELKWPKTEQCRKMDWTRKSAIIVIGVVLFIALIWSGLGGHFIAAVFIESRHQFEKLSAESESRQAFPRAFISLCAGNHFVKHTLYESRDRNTEPSFSGMFSALSLKELDEADPLTENVLECLRDSARAASLRAEGLFDEERHEALDELLNAAAHYYPAPGQGDNIGRRIADGILRGGVIKTSYDGHVAPFSFWITAAAPQRERAAALLEDLGDAAPDRSEGFAFYAAALSITPEEARAVRLFEKCKALLLKTPGAIIAEARQTVRWLVDQAPNEDILCGVVEDFLLGNPATLNWNLAADILYRLERPENQARLFEVALATLPGRDVNNRALWYGLYEKTQDSRWLEAALDYLRKSFSWLPSWDERLYLAETLMMRGEYDEALRQHSNWLLDGAAGARDVTDYPYIPTRIQSGPLAVPTMRWKEISLNYRLPSADGESVQRHSHRPQEVLRDHARALAPCLDAEPGERENCARSITRDMRPEAIRQNLPGTSCHCY